MADLLKVARAKFDEMDKTAQEYSLRRECDPRMRENLNAQRWGALQIIQSLESERPAPEAPPRRLPYMHEDELPQHMPRKDYDDWYQNSQIVFGVRVGPIYPGMAGSTEAGTLGAKRNSAPHVGRCGICGSDVICEHDLAARRLALGEVGTEGK